MKCIQAEDFKITEPTAVCIGKFEGLHKGHQLLIQKAKESGLKTVLFALQIEEKKSLFLLEEKKQLAKEMGIDYLVSFPFTDKVKAMEPDEFIREVIVKSCHASYVVVGEDFRFGSERKGTTKTLEKLGFEYGFQVCVLKKMRYDGSIVSSSRIREEVLLGRCNKVNDLLGFPYFFTGEVIRGNQIGRTLQMPTANLMIPSQKVVPPKGVYASITHMDGIRYPGVTNIGIKPTILGNKSIGVETFLFDFDQDIYGKEIRVDLIAFLRTEEKFSGLSELKEQMHRDKENAKKVLSGI